MGSVAEGLVRALAAAAERNHRATGQTEGTAGRVEDLELALDADRAII